MDLKKRLNLGHPKAQTNEIVDYVDGSRSRFKQLVKVYLEGPYRITQRAAMPLTNCVAKWPYLIDNHLKRLIFFLGKPDASDTLKRNTIRLFQFIDIPKRYQGKVADLCFAYLNDKKAAVAIRVFAMTVLFNITKDEPELRNEFKLILEEQLPFGSAAFRSRGGKIFSALSQSPQTQKIK